MADAVVGTATILIKALDTGLADDVRTKVQRATSAVKAEAKIDADTTAANQAISKLATTASAVKAEAKVTADTSTAESALNRVQTNASAIKAAVKVDADTSTAERSLNDLKGTIGGVVASIAGGLGAAGLGEVLQDLGRQATELQLIGAKARTVFGEEAGAVRDWAQSIHRDLGLTTDRVVELAAGLADLLKPMGFTNVQAAAMAQELIGLSGALSAWSAGQRTVAEVSDIITAAIMGEREGLKQLGISISEADIQTRLATKGQKDLTGAALEQAKALATMELILAKSTDAQKAYGDGSLDAAKKTNHFKAALGALREEAAKFVGPAAEIGGAIARTAGPALVGLNALNQMLIANGRSLGGVARAAAPYATTLGGMAVAAYAGAKAGDALASSGESYAVKIDRQINKIPVLGGLLQTLGVTHRTTADKTDDHAAAEERLEVQFKLTAEQAQELERRLNDVARAQGDAFNAQMSVTDAHHRAWENAVRLREAEQELTEAYRDHGRGSAEAEEAEIALEGARINSQRGVIALAKALTEQEMATRQAKVASGELAAESVSDVAQQEVYRQFLLQLAGTVKDPMRSEILLLTGNLRDLSEVKPKIEVQVNTEGARARIAELRAQLNTLEGNTAERAQELYRLQNELYANAPFAPDLDFSNRTDETRQHGGPVVPGHRYRVGEVAEEELTMFPGGGGFVRPLSTAGGGRSSQPTVINFTQSMSFGPGTDATDAYRGVRKANSEMASILEALIARLNAGAGTRGR